jgi:hypothetical protein
MADFVDLVVGYCGFGFPLLAGAAVFGPAIGWADA